MKTCSRCGGYKTIASFRKNKQAKGGFDWWCRNCRSDYEVERKNKKTRLRRRNHDVVESLDLATLLEEVWLEAS